MKFIVGLRVWVNGGSGKTPQVVPRFRGSANRRVDLFLPLIASIPGRSRTGHRRASDAESYHGHKPGPLGIGRLKMPGKGDGTVENWSRTNPKCGCNSLTAIE